MSFPLLKQRDIALELIRDAKPLLELVTDIYNEEVEELVGRRENLISETHRHVYHMLMILGNIIGILKKCGTLSESYKCITSRTILDFINEEPLMKYYCSNPRKLTHDISSDNVESTIQDLSLAFEGGNFIRSKYESKDQALSTMGMSLASEDSNALSLLSFSFIAMRISATSKAGVAPSMGDRVVSSHTLSLNKNTYPRKSVDAGVLLLYEQVLLYDTVKTSLAMLIAILSDIAVYYEAFLPKASRLISIEQLSLLTKIACTDSLITTMDDLVLIEFPDMLRKYCLMWGIIERPKINYTVDLEILEKLASGELDDGCGGLVNDLAKKDLPSLNSTELGMLFALIDRIKGGGYGTLCDKGKVQPGREYFQL